MNETNPFFDLSLKELHHRMSGPGHGPSYKRSWIIVTLDPQKMYTTKLAAALLQSELGLATDTRMIDTLGQYVKGLEPSAERSWPGGMWQDRHSERGRLRGELAQCLFEHQLISPSELFTRPQSWETDRSLIQLLQQHPQRAGEQQQALPVGKPWNEETSSPLPRVLNAFRLWPKCVKQLAVLMLVVFSLAAARMNPYQTYEIYQTQGTMAAASYSFALIAAGDNAQHLLYQSAYIDFANGSYAVAERKIQKILLKQPNHQKLKADCLYLLGLIADAKGGNDHAMGYLKSALMLYREANYDRNQVNTLIQLAQVSLNREDFPEAERYLDEAWQQHEQTGQADLDFYHGARSALAIRQKHYAEALFHALEKRKLLPISNAATSQPDPLPLAASLSGTGFLYLLMGEYDLGIQNTKQAEALLMQAPDKEFYISNLINEILYFRCQGLPINPVTMELVLAWIEEHPHPKLKADLNLALTHDCP